MSVLVMKLEFLWRGSHILLEDPKHFRNISSHQRNNILAIMAYQFTYDIKKCHYCGNSCLTSKGFDTKFPWCTKWTCGRPGVCGKSFYTCDGSCSFIGNYSNAPTKVMVAPWEVRKHASRRHGGTMVTPEKPVVTASPNQNSSEYPSLSMTESEIDNAMAAVEMDEDNGTEGMEESAKEEVDFFSYGSETSCPYSDMYQWSVAESPVVAAQRMLTMAMSQDKSKATTDLPKNIPSKCFLFFLYFSILVLNIGSQNYYILCKMLTCLVSVCNPTIKDGWIRFPMNPKEIRSCITNRSNTKSLMHNIPKPKVTCIGKKQDHAYTSESEIIAFSMFLPSKANFNISARLVNLCSEKKFQDFITQIKELLPTLKYEGRTVVILSLGWFDGFDPSLSNKSNRKPIHATTCTLLFWDLIEGKPYYVGSFLQAAGPSKANHDCVFDHMLEDGKDFVHENGTPKGKVFYSTYHAAEVLCFRKRMFFLMDSPERASSTHLQNGNSNKHSYFGISCNTESLLENFECCEDCYGEVCTYIQRSDWKKYPFHRKVRCSNCLQFSWNNLVQRGNYKEPLYDLPHDVFADAPGYLLNIGPGRITSKLLIEAFEWSVENYLNNRNITRKQHLRNYYSLLCINDDTAKEWIEIMENCIVWKAITEQPDEFSDDEKLEVRASRELNPQDYLPPTCPAIWHMMELENIVEVPMHTLWNVQRSEYKHLLIAYLKKFNKWSTYLVRVNLFINLIADLKNEETKLVKISSDKIGGYVAENYRLLTRYTPWLSNILSEPDMKRKTDLPIQNPHLNPPKNWKKPELVEWLVSKRLPYSKEALKDELLATVNRFLDMDPESWPVAPIDPSLSITDTSMRELFMALFEMSSSFMATDLPGQHGYNRAFAFTVKFLYLLNSIDVNLPTASEGDDKAKSIWVRRYNHIRLLRLCDNFLLFGTVRNTWEGGQEGEGIVKDL